MSTQIHTVGVPGSVGDEEARKSEAGAGNHKETSMNKTQ